ncbi:CYTH domain-containing protein [Capnocytophaga sp. ARDL2]|uniref:CYTH domain-containing protein n=1 Tax=Capnocytophaga sp. ARDL2 TaxID=3238809 RepID=UPI0035587C53
MIEIERKFSLKNTNFLASATKSYKITQGYLNSLPERTVRIRTKGNKGFITIKGKSNENLTSRFEWEKEIPVEEALQLLALCEDFVIEKTRYEVPFGNHLWEIDVFHGANEGLMIAEIELESENEQFDLPDWVDNEITLDNRFFNAYLSNHPYKTWK